MVLTAANGVAFQIDENDYDLIAAHRWRAYDYVVTYANGATVYLHRFLMKPPPGLQADHINRDKLDNRRCNLRVVDRATNTRNRPARRGSPSGIRGVLVAPNGKFRATSGVNGRTINLGTYATAEDAAHAYATFVRGLEH